MNVLVLFVKFLTIGLLLANAARILAVFPTPSISHQVVFREYTQQLARRGHELVIVTPDPAFSKIRPPDNITEIDVAFSYRDLEDIFKKNNYDRGVISNHLPTTIGTFKVLLNITSQQLKHPSLRKIIDRREKFDLIIIEALYFYLLILTEFIKAPVIQISSFYASLENMDAMGAVSRHPLYFRHHFGYKFGSYSLWENIYQIFFELYIRSMFYSFIEDENRQLINDFGENAPTVQELMDNIDLLFVNTHPILDNNRPVPPNVIYLGALHLKPVKELPRDLLDYLDSSEKGVVFVSFGTNTRPSRMHYDFFMVFKEAFEKLPYDVLWKFDKENVTNIMPKNVKIQKWFPQRDLLAHPNIKAFVTQGGLQSTDEAIDAGVPLVGIPMLADQWFNVNKYVELGIGIYLNPKTLTTDQLVSSVNKVVTQESYRYNLQRIKKVFQDQPQSPLERAIWWTEYVIRHRGAKHLRSPTANKSWAEYLMLDAVAVILLVTLLVILFIVVLLVYLVKLYNQITITTTKLKII